MSGSNCVCGLWHGDESVVGRHGNWWNKPHDPERDTEREGYADERCRKCGRVLRWKERRGWRHHDDTKAEVCPTCHGTGRIAPSDRSSEPPACERCGGCGCSTDHSRDPKDRDVTHSGVCSTCGGSGRA